jgi:hypothetical protein
VAEHGHFALARFSAATAEVVHNPSFEIGSKFFSVCAWVHSKTANQLRQESSKSKCCSVGILETRIHTL